MSDQYVRPNWDAFTGLFGIIFGVVYGVQAYTMPKAMFGNPWDPIYFPLGVAAISILIGVSLLIKSDFKASIRAARELLNEDKVKKNDRRRILYTCMISVMYALLFEHLGYILSTCFFMFSMLTITSGLSVWKKNCVVAIIFSIGIFFVFNTLLAVSLPPLPFFE